MEEYSPQLFGLDPHLPLASFQRHDTLSPLGQSCLNGINEKHPAIKTILGSYLNLCNLHRSFISCPSGLSGYTALSRIFPQPFGSQRPKQASNKLFNWQSGGGNKFSNV